MDCSIAISSQPLGTSMCQALYYLIRTLQLPNAVSNIIIPILHVRKLAHRVKVIKLPSCKSKSGLSDAKAEALHSTIMPPSVCILPRWGAHHLSR